MDHQPRKRGKDKSKDTFNKYGKYSNKAIRIRTAVQAAISSKTQRVKVKS